MLSFLKSNKVLFAGIILGLIILFNSGTRRNFFEGLETTAPANGQNKHDATYDAATKKFCDAINTQMQKETPESIKDKNDKVAKELIQFTSSKAYLNFSVNNPELVCWMKVLKTVNAANSTMMAQIIDKIMSVLADIKSHLVLNSNGGDSMGMVANNAVLSGHFDKKPLVI